MDRNRELLEESSELSHTKQSKPFLGNVVSTSNTTVAEIMPSSSTSGFTASPSSSMFPDISNRSKNSSSNRPALTNNHNVHGYGRLRSRSTISYLESRNKNQTSVSDAVSKQSTNLSSSFINAFQMPQNLAQAFPNMPSLPNYFPVSMPSMPNISIPSMPSISMPSMPTLTMPNLSMPNISMPTMNLSIPSISDIMSREFTLVPNVFN